MLSDHERFERPTRRQFLQAAGGAAGALLSGGAAYAHHHPRPSPQSLKYLDQRTYVNNMELVAHFTEGGVGWAGRGGLIQLMTIGPHRFLFQGRDVIDVSDPRNPRIINKGGAATGEIGYNAQLKKWILMEASQPSYPAADFPGGKYDDPSVNEKFMNWKGLRGIRLYDVTDPTKVVKISEFSTGQTGSGTHPDSNFYDGGKYAYLDCAPDDSYTGMVANLTPLSNSLVIVDVSDPSNVKEVSRWHVPGQRAGVPGETQELKKWKCLQGRGVEAIPDKPLTVAEATRVFRTLKFPAFDRFPYTMSHLPCYVPKRVEDGGRLGYGSWSAFGFLIHDLSDITKPRLVGRFDPTPAYGLDGIPFHTVWLGMLDRGFIVTISEALNPDCNESYLPCWVVDVRDPRNPVPIAMLPRPRAPKDAPFDDFCFSRGRFSPHLAPPLTAPGKPSQTILPVSWFSAGVRVFDLSEPTQPKEVASFVPPHGGTLSPECTAPQELTGEAYTRCDQEGNSYNRPADTLFVEWDRKLIYVGTTTGLYVLSSPALGKPVLGPMPATEWSLPGHNLGAPA